MAIENNAMPDRSVERGRPAMTNGPINKRAGFAARWSPTMLYVKVESNRYTDRCDWRRELSPLAYLRFPGFPLVYFSNAATVVTQPRGVLRPGMRPVRMSA